MLYAFGFETIGVVLSDLYFLDPSQREGQDGDGAARTVTLVFQSTRLHDESGK